MRVRLYRNLASQYKNQYAWSILKPDGKVLSRVPFDGAVLVNCTFTVYEAPRQYIIHVIKKKKPCCYVIGDLIKTYALNTLPRTTNAEQIAPGSGANVLVTIDPFTMPFFVRKDCGQYVHESPTVVASPMGLFADLPPCARRAGRDDPRFWDPSLAGLDGLDGHEWRSDYAW